MPERDDTVEIEMPSLQASKGDDVDEHDITIDATGGVDGSDKTTDADLSLNAVSPGNHSESETFDQQQAGNSSALNKIFLLLSVVFALALVVAFVLLQQQSNAYSKAEARIADLESRLSSTDESVNQSSVALQVKVKELKDRTNELEKQMDKLWASAWRRNQNEIASHTKSIEKHDKALSLAKVTLNDVQTLSQRLEKDVEGLKKHSANIKGFQSNLKKQQESLTRLQQSLKSMQQSQLSIKAIAEENSEWIQSINVFRKQTNQAISRMEQQLNTNKGK